MRISLILHAGRVDRSTSMPQPAGARSLGPRSLLLYLDHDWSTSIVSGVSWSESRSSICSGGGPCGYVCVAACLQSEPYAHSQFWAQAWQKPLCRVALLDLRWYTWRHCSGCWEFVSFPPSQRANDVAIVISCGSIWWWRRLWYPPLYPPSWQEVVEVVPRSLWCPGVEVDLVQSLRM